MTANAETTGSERRWKPGAWWLAALLPPVLFLSLYARTLPYEFVWTDRTELVQGLLVRPPSRILAAFAQPMYEDLAAISPGSTQSYYRPVKVVAVSLVDQAFGREAAAFRAVNLVAGGLTFALLALLAGTLFGDPRAGALVALLAAAHPAGIENYVWPSGMDDALAKLFMVASLLASVRAARTRSARARIQLGALALLLFALALGSKESAVVTPVLAAACLWLGGRKADTPPSTRLGLVGSQLLLLLAYALVVRPLVVGGMAAGASPIGDRYPLHLLTALATWPDRLLWVFLPWPSTTSDVVRVVSVILEPRVVLAVGLVVLAPFALWRLWRAGQGMIALGLVWLLVAFAPTSGVLPLTHLRAERHLALPAIGAAFIVVSILFQLAGRGRQGRFRSGLALVLACGMLAGLAVMTHVRLSDWRSDRVLFARDVEGDPFFREGRYALAASLFEAGRPEEAREQLHELEAINRKFGMRASYLRQDAAVSLLCQVNLSLGLASETVELLGEQIRADSPALGAAPAFFLCGAQSLEELGRLGEAREIYQAMDLLPRVGQDPRVDLGLARVHARLGDLAAARLFLLRTPREFGGDPAYAESRRELDRLLRQP